MKKNKDYFIEQTAKKLNISPSIVELVINKSYKDNIRKINNSPIYEVEIPYIGTLKLNQKKVPEHLDILYKKKQSLDKKFTLHKQGLLPLTDKEFQKLEIYIRNINKDINTLESRYLEFKQQQNANINKRSLEEQKINSGGSDK